MTEQRRKTPDGYVRVEVWYEEHLRGYRLGVMLEQLNGRFRDLTSAIHGETTSTMRRIVELEAEFKSEKDPQKRVWLKEELVEQRSTHRAALAIAGHDRLTSDSVHHAVL